MARPREFNEEAALGSAMMAFWRTGYHATGIQDLVEATGVHRASLYGTFGVKEQLFLAALRRYTEICIVNLRAALETGSTPADGISRMLDYFLGNLLHTERGCLLYNTALEISAKHVTIGWEVEAGMERIEALLVPWVRRAQAAGEADGSLDPMLLARTAMAAMHSMTVRSGSGASREVLESIRDGGMLPFHQGAAHNV